MCVRLADILGLVDNIVYTLGSNNLMKGCSSHNLKKAGMVKAFDKLVVSA